MEPIQEQHQIDFYFQFENSRYKPNFQFLINQGDDNAQMLEQFGCYSDTWRRFSVNGQICYADYSSYCSDGVNFAGGPYKNYILTEMGEILFVEGGSDILYKGGNYEKPSATIRFEEIEDEKIKRLLLGNDIETGKMMDEHFFRKDGVYRRFKPSSDSSKISVEKKSSEGGEKEFERNSGGIYEIIERSSAQTDDFSCGSSDQITGGVLTYPENMPQLPDEVKRYAYAFMDMEKREVPNKKNIVFAEALAEVCKTPKELLKSKKQRCNIIYEAAQKAKDRINLYFVYSERIGKIQTKEYTDNKRNIWHIDAANIKSLLGADYVVGFIPKKLERKTKLPEIGDCFLGELLEGKHNQKLKPITAALKG